MDRRRFEHLVVELSLALDLLVPRYPLWLCLHECGFDPERLSRDHAIAFCDAPLARFLAANDLGLSPRAARRVRRRVARFDPDLPSPTDQLSRLGESEH